MAAESGPLPLSHALAQLIAMRGFARQQGDAQLKAVWDAVAGSEIAARTRVAGISRGVLAVGVANSALLNELTGFHKPGLLAALKRDRPELRIRDIKFRLNSDIKPPATS